MALLTKVSFATALPTTRSLAAELGKLAREAGQVPGLESILRGLGRVEEHLAGQGLEVEIVLVTPLDGAAAVTAAAWLAPDFPPATLQSLPATPVRVESAGPGRARLGFFVRALSATVPVPAGTPRPPLLVVAAGAPVRRDDVGALEPLLEGRPHVMLLGARAPELEARAAALAWSAEAVASAAPPAQGLGAALSAPPWEPLQPMLRAESAVGALDSLGRAFDAAFEALDRDARVQKAMAQAKLGRPVAKPLLGAAPGAEVVAAVKARIQALVAELEQGVADRMLDLVAPGSGTLTRETEALLAGLDHLHQEPKATRIETRIPEQFEKKLVRTLRERIGRHCASDVVAANDLFRMLGQETERILQAHDGPAFVPQLSYLTDERARRLLDMTVVPQAQYRGELPKPGFTEYFASVRKYSMLLVMGASMFGMASLMRSYKEFTIPLTILLVGFGTYSVITSTAQQRAENTERELEAARLALRPDVRRILADVQKAWPALVSDHLSQQVSALLAAVEAAVRDHFTRRGAEANPERERLQRRIAALEVADKRLLPVRKQREALQSTLDQVRAELRNLWPKPSVAAPPPAPASPPVAKAAAPAGSSPSATATPAPSAPAEAPVEPQAAPPVDESKRAFAAVEQARAKLAALKADAAARKAAREAAAASQPPKPPSGDGSGGVA
ncbi:MAG TPA: hypothetical protein VIJ10_19010 [Vicinamibacteria bacterium]